MYDGPRLPVTTRTSVNDGDSYHRVQYCAVRQEGHVRQENDLVERGRSGGFVLEFVAWMENEWKRFSGFWIIDGDTTHNHLHAVLLFFVT